MNGQKKLFAMAAAATSCGGKVSHLKTQRFFHPKKPMHLVLRSEHATGAHNFLTVKNDHAITTILGKAAKTFHVRIHEWVNVGNHLHLKIRARDRSSLQAFLRTISGLIARAVTGARRGRPFRGANNKANSAKKIRFWTSLVFTRVVATFYEEKILARYFNANAAEAAHGKEFRDAYLAGTPITPLTGNRRSSA